MPTPDLAYDPMTKNLVFNPNTKDLAYNCGEPLGDCPYCPDGATPNQYDITFADVDLTPDCQDCLYSGSLKVIGTLDGTYRVTRTLAPYGESLCWWQVQTDIVIRYYDSDDCTGDYVEDPVFIILYHQGPPLATWHINVTPFVTTAASLFGSGSNGDYPVIACQSDLPVFSNEGAGYGCSTVGINGTATVSLP